MKNGKLPEAQHRGWFQTFLIAKALEHFEKTYLDPIKLPKQEWPLSTIAMAREIKNLQQELVRFLGIEETDLAGR